MSRSENHDDGGEVGIRSAWICSDPSPESGRENAGNRDGDDEAQSPSGLLIPGNHGLSDTCTCELHIKGEEDISNQLSTSDPLQSMTFSEIDWIHSNHWRQYGMRLPWPFRGSSVPLDRSSLHGQDFEDRKADSFRRRRLISESNKSADERQGDDPGSKRGILSDLQVLDSEQFRDLEAHFPTTSSASSSSSCPSSSSSYSSSLLLASLLGKFPSFFKTSLPKEPRSPPPSTPVDASDGGVYGGLYLGSPPLHGLSHNWLCRISPGLPSSLSHTPQLSRVASNVATPPDSDSVIGRLDPTGSNQGSSNKISHVGNRVAPEGVYTPSPVGSSSSRLTPRTQAPGTTTGPGLCPGSAMSPQEDFLLILLKALSAYGGPIHRMEYNLHYVSQHLGVNSRFAISPNIAWVWFCMTNTHPQLRLFLVPLEQGFELAKLEDVNYLCNELFQSKITINQAAAQIKAIIAATPSWPILKTVVEILSYAVIGWSICLTGFGGSWIDSGFSFIGGLICGILCYFASTVSLHYMQLLEFASAMIISCLTRICQVHFAPILCIDLIAVVFSGIVVLLPGLSLTIAIMELTSKNMVSGTVRLFHAILIVVFLGFGVVVGTHLADGLTHLWSHSPSSSSSASSSAAAVGVGSNTSSEHASTSSSTSSSSHSSRICSNHDQDPVSYHWFFIIFPFLSISISISYKAKMSQWIPMMIVSAIGFIVTLVLSPHLAIEATITISALIMTLSSNIYSRITCRLGIAPILGGILLLVPGSIGVRGTLSLIEESDVLSATSFAFRMMSVAVAITVGVFIGSAVVCPVKEPKQRFHMML